NVFMFWGGGIFFFFFFYPNPSSCSHPARVFLDKDVPQYELKMAMVFDAYKNGDKVDFHLSGCTQAGQQQNPTVTNVNFYKTP
ncbi:MAG: hypothetical protein MJA83_11520, partial [Gammaproteobacteria bacterium]|nr:hypothetical protein [Gammaproteobacteria bacterium]